MLNPHFWQSQKAPKPTAKINSAWIVIANRAINVARLQRPTVPLVQVQLLWPSRGGEVPLAFVKRDVHAVSLL